jgi:hypothetical protein
MEERAGEAYDNRCSNKGRNIPDEALSQMKPKFPHSGSHAAPFKVIRHMTNAQDHRCTPRLVSTIKKQPSLTFATKLRCSACKIDEFFNLFKKCGYLSSWCKVTMSPEMHLGFPQ